MTRLITRVAFLVAVAGIVRTPELAGQAPLNALQHSAAADSLAQPAITPEVSLAIDMEKKDHRWRGALVGAVTGGIISVVLTRMTQGKCNDEDAYFPCEVGYAMMFVVGAVPGSVIGYIVGRQTKN